ncbi:hypothetical protein SteCoe_24175 [Stentor coeruleus]|uniref:Uncharacterized protein n=1 Tax=Stentor coeruleus TaxID=5963 RepID=A0A1R2BI56_9CILI|nr:hypothetical protein SteCoe_24175 [Stentor coeruleus]
MSSKQGLQSKTEDKKYFIEIMKVDEEESVNSLEGMSIYTSGNLSSDFVKSIKQAQENFKKKVHLHALSSQTVECKSRAFSFEAELPIRAVKKVKHLNTVEELRFHAKSAKAFQNVIKKRKANVKSSCACVIV